MKPLVIIPSCEDHQYRHGGMATMMPDELDFHFFMGAGNSPEASWDIVLPVRDDYWALPQKVRMAFRWALEQMEPDGSWTYSHIFKTDTDTLIYGDRLRTHYQEEIAPKEIDYLGLVGNPGDCCGGGAGYWLSRKAMIAYLDNYDERQLNLATWQQLEDWCLFRVLDRSNPRVSPLCDRRYWDMRLGPIPDESTVITVNPGR